MAFTQLPHPQADTPTFSACQTVVLVTCTLVTFEETKVPLGMDAQLGCPGVPSQPQGPSG